jgi:hypothetical protein
MDFLPIPRDHTAACPAAPPRRRSEKMVMEVPDLLVGDVRDFFRRFR